jgi:hypothetical protein
MKTSGGWNRTCDLGLMKGATLFATPLPDNTSGDTAPPHVPQHVPAGLTDPDLTRLIDAWPELPAHIRAAVLAMVQTAR